MAMGVDNGHNPSWLAPSGKSRDLRVFGSSGRERRKGYDSELFVVTIWCTQIAETMAPQELRNVAYRGPLNSLVYDLAANNFLRQQLKIRSEKSKAYQIMADAEYVLRFLTLRQSWTSFSGDYRTEMDNFMQEHQNASDERVREYQWSFNSAIETCQEIWCTEAFKRPIADGWRDQLLAGMYDAEMIAVDRIAGHIREVAIDRSNWIRAQTRELFRDDQFEQAVRQGTNTPSRIMYRIERVVELLNRATE